MAVVSTRHGLAKNYRQHEATCPRLVCPKEEIMRGLVNYTSYTLTKKKLNSTKTPSQINQIKETEDRWKEAHCQTVSELVLTQPVASSLVKSRDGWLLWCCLHGKMTHQIGFSFHIYM